MKVIWQELVNGYWADGESAEMSPCEARNFVHFLNKQVVSEVRWVALCA